MASIHSRFLVPALSSLAPALYEFYLDSQAKASRLIDSLKLNPDSTRVIKMPKIDVSSTQAEALLGEPAKTQILSVKMFHQSSPTNTYFFLCGQDSLKKAIETSSFLRLSPLIAQKLSERCANQTLSYSGVFQVVCSVFAENIDLLAEKEVSEMLPLIQMTTNVVLSSTKHTCISSHDFSNR